MPIVLITGGNRGLGRAYVQALLSSPKSSTYKIAITARNLKAAETAAQELSPNCQVVGYACDIEQEDQVHHLKESIEKDFKGLDILINNAGTSDPFNR
jgi:NAD(P)-dependent dehydrogenase (short-subunit alcohol dehydrogenase family)